MKSEIMSQGFASLFRRVQKLTIGVAAIGVAAIAASGVESAEAVSINATVTADNFYALYHGKGDGSGMTYIMRNETGPTGTPGTFNWSIPETASFTMPDDHYLYIAGWSDNFVAQGLLGSFSVTDAYGTWELNTNVTDWEVYLSNEDPGTPGDPFPGTGSAEPSTATMAGYAAAANGGGLWQTINTTADHGAPNIPFPGSVWGIVPGVSMNADWIWQGPQAGLGFDGSINGYGEFQIFRTRRPVPEPTTMLLLGGGLLGAGISRRRAARKA